MLHYAEGENTRKEREREKETERTRVERRADIEIAKGMARSERDEWQETERGSRGPAARGSNKNDGIVLTSLL